VQDRIGYYFIVMASVVVILAGIKSASTIVIPFLLSIFIAIILSPLYNFFNEKKIPHILSLILVIVLFMTFLLSVGKLIGTSAHDFSSNIGVYEQQLHQVIHKFADMASSIGLEIPETEISSIINSKQIMLFSSSVFKSVSSMFSNSFIVLLSVVFMLLESEHLVNKIAKATDDNGIIQNIEEILSKIKRYMVIKSLISLFTGLVIWISLLIIGTDYAFLWAGFAFLLNFIPNIGSIIAAVPAVLLTLIQLGSLSALVVTGLYVSVNIIIGSIVEPRIMGNGLGLSTLIVFLSLLFWGWLLGIVGMLLSIPLTIMAKIVFDSNQKTRWIAIFLGTGKN
jgi:predicted PurR-regulated permease PerM